MYLGESAKGHQIFRAIKWNQNLEKVIKRPLFNQAYQKIGIILDVFGPVDRPFISVRKQQKSEISSDNQYYVKGT